MLSLGLGAASAFGGAGADQVALHVGEAAENGEHQAPGLVPVLAHGSRDRNCVRTSTMRLMTPNKSKVLDANRPMHVTPRRHRGPDGRACKEARAGRPARLSPCTR